MVGETQSVFIKATAAEIERQRQHQLDEIVQFRRRMSPEARQESGDESGSEVTVRWIPFFR